MNISSSTVAAIATPNAPGGIGIIRISGDKALEIASRVFIPVSKAEIKSSKGYKAYFGDIVAGKEKIDEGVCLVFKAPHSYTGEDVAEINCHGGLFVTKQVLRAVIEAGAEPAGPGEFTKRAFLNGKMDLAESESVMSLISASGRQAASCALNTLEGKLSGEIKSCRDRLVNISATLSAWVDYPDDEIEELESGEVLSTLLDVKSKLNAIIKRYDNGKVMTDGVDTAIVGKPNVGKSTIMNLLAGYERSIVTDIAGTTRDVVEERVAVGDIILRIADTAGIHNTDNLVENLGVSLAKKRLDRAELVIAVFDGSREISEEDMNIIKASGDKKRIAIINKSDLEQKINSAEIKANFDRTVNISGLTGEGREDFEKALSKLLISGDFDTSAACLTSERQRACCIKATEHLDEAINALNLGITLDAVNVCTDCAISCLLELTGEKASETIVNDIFSRFCVGK